MRHIQGMEESFPSSIEVGNSKPTKARQLLGEMLGVMLRLSNFSPAVSLSRIKVSVNRTTEIRWSTLELIEELAEGCEKGEMPYIPHCGPSGIALLVHN